MEYNVKSIFESACFVKANITQAGTLRMEDI